MGTGRGEDELVALGFLPKQVEFRFLQANVSPDNRRMLIHK
jgi:hypothetical protein